jgi:hypothetical protein
MVGAVAYGAISDVRVAPVLRTKWRTRQGVALAGMGLVAVVVLLSVVGWTAPHRVVLQEEQADGAAPVLAAWPGPYTAMPYMHDPRSGITYACSRCSRRKIVS